MRRCYTKAEFHPKTAESQRTAFGALSAALLF